MKNKLNESVHILLITTFWNSAIINDAKDTIYTDNYIIVLVVMLLLFLKCLNIIHLTRGYLTPRTHRYQTLYITLYNHPMSARLFLILIN